MDIKEIEIPIFVHPHLFWIFWRRDTERRLQLQNELAKEYSSQSKQKDEDFTIGEIVVVKKNLIWKRAAIEKIVEGNNYEVWLLDYGYLELTSTVHKLNSKFDLLKQPPLIHQASLWNVVFVNEDLNIENSSIDIHRNTLPNAGATLNALQFMSDHQLFFRKIKEVNGILFGDIMYKKDGETSSLIKALIDKQLMVEDAQLFLEVESSRTKDKSFHSAALRQASKKHEDSRFSFDLSLLMDEVFMRNTSRGISLVSDREISSQETNSSQKNVSRSELMKKLRKKSQARKDETLSCTESEREEIVDDGRSPSDIENHIPKASKLRNLIERRKSTVKANLKSGTEEVTSSSETNICCDSDTIFSATSKLAALKLRAAKANVKENLEKTDEKLEDNSGKPKLLQAPHSSFFPGGVRLMTKKKGTPSGTSTGKRKDLKESVQNRRSSSTGECDLKEKNHENANKENSPQSKFDIMKKFTERRKTLLSNTSDASDAEMMKEEKQNNNIEGDLSEVPHNLHEKNILSPDDSQVNSSGDLLNNNCESNIESNTSYNSEFESNKKESDEIEENKGKVIADTDRNNDYIPEKAADSQMVVKPFCTCSQCQFWTSSEGWDIGSGHFTEEDKCKRKKMRPQSLMLKGDRAEEVKLSSIEYRFMTKLEKNASFKILVHGRLIPPAINRVVEAPFHNAIHKSLSKLKYIRTKKIQSYVWPAISRSMNVCYIHRKKSGKTLAHLPPLCSFLLEREERYNDLKKGGPIAVVLGKSSTECEEIYDMANKLVEGVGHNKPRILLVTYPFQYVNLSSVDMLITIPPILIELLKKNATNLKRLCHLVLENIDVLLQKYTDEIKSIVAAIESMLLQRNIRQNVQMIMSGEHWTLKVEQFLMNLRDLPLISIGDYLEASIYGGIKLKVKLLEAKAKCDNVVDILRDKWKFHKCIIICNANEEIELLKTALDLASISYIPITDDLPIEHIYQNESNWESHCAGQFTVLICTDEVLNTMLSITSASLLIHFSLPSKWSFWIKRFYCLLENYKSPFTKSNDELKCEAYILTDELCVDQIPRLLSLLKNYNVSLQQFEPVCKQIEIKKEEAKIDDQVPLCSSLKQFGYCHIINCSDRHLLDRELDYNPSLPQNGTIKFKILELIDVNHLKVKIMEHKDIEGKITNFDSQKGLDDDKLTSILNQKRNRAENIENLFSYAYWDDEDFNDMFRECIVENIRNNVVDILVKKNNKRITVSKSKIFQLPEEFNRNNDTSCSTDVIIANFKPPYKDEKFSAIAYFKLSRYIEDIRNDDNIFVSNICLQLENTIWVNTISEEVNVYDLSLTKSNLTRELVKRQLAETNPEHMEKLYSLCKEAKILLPEYIVPIQEQINREPPQEIPQWAFLDVNSCNMVYFASAVTPDEIYVRIAKFDSLLRSLEKDLIEVANRQGSKQDFGIFQGRYYLAKDPMEEKFVRVLVKRIEDSKALCFSVDYGDEFVVPLSDIRYLSNYMIKKLPFQAIHCRLFGISSIGGEWPVEAVDVLYENFTFETDSDVYRTLYAKCIIYEKGTNKGQSFFSILLKDVYEQPILINQLLIDCGWAALIPECNLIDFEVPVEEYESEDCISSEDENDLEKIKDIIETSKSISSNHIVPKAVTARNNTENMEDNDELEFFFGGSGDEIDNFIDFIDAMNKTSEQTAIHSAEICNNLPAIEAAPFEVDYLTPDVYWSQTKKRIDMCIKLPNVETYSVKLLKSRIFNFETTVDEKRYVVHLVLYESVEKNFRHTLGGLEIKIVFKKNKEEEWPKLCRSKHRLRNVHYLLSKEQMENDDDPDKLFLDLGEDLKDSTDDESDGVIFDVYSDRDSEYDLELPEDVDL